MFERIGLVTCEECALYLVRLGESDYSDRLAIRLAAYFRGSIGLLLMPHVDWLVAKFIEDAQSIIMHTLPGAVVGKRHHQSGHCLRVCNI